MCSECVCVHVHIPASSMNTYALWGCAHVCVHTECRSSDEHGSRDYGHYQTLHLCHQRVRQHFFHSLPFNASYLCDAIQLLGRVTRQKQDFKGDNRQSLRGREAWLTFKCLMSKFPKIVPAHLHLLFKHGQGCP